MNYRSPYVVYGLYDPKNDSLRYIGKTNNLKIRFSRHLRDAKKGVRTHAHRWIAKLLLDGLQPVARVIQECFSGENSLEAEVYWIRFFRSSGHNLCNLTDGGEGALGAKRSPEVCANISKRLMGHSFSVESRKKSSLSHRRMTMDQVLEAKSLRPFMSFSKLAAKYGVCQATVYNAVNNKYLWS